METSSPTGRWLRIWRGESKNLKTNATLGDTENSKQTDIGYMAHVNILARRQDCLLSTVKRRNLSWFGHVCHHYTLPKIKREGTVEVVRRTGRPLKLWKDIVNELTGQSLSSLVRIADDRSRQATSQQRGLLEHHNVARGSWELVRNSQSLIVF